MYKRQAFSRVTSLENLYINGTFKPPASANFGKDKVLLEMERMRNECPHKISLRFPTRSDRNEQYNVLYQNIRCVNKKIKYIESDVTYVNCDILILVETRTTKDSEISLKKIYPHLSKRWLLKQYSRLRNFSLRTFDRY